MPHAQDGYDEFLDAFYRKSRNEEVMGLVELRRLLEGFGCAVTPSDLHNILAEAKEVRRTRTAAAARAPSRSVACRARSVGIPGWLRDLGSTLRSMRG